MRLEMPVARVMAFAAGLCLALSGCATDDPYSAAAPPYPSPDETLSRAAPDAFPGGAPARLPAPWDAAPRLEDGGVSWASLEVPDAPEDNGPGHQIPTPGDADAPSVRRGAARGDASSPTPHDASQAREADKSTGSPPGEPQQIQPACELDFSSALAMVSGRNPRIAFASQRYREAYARLEAASVLWLPSIRGGVSYNKHEQILQAANGDVLNASRGSLYTGFGARAVGTGSPTFPGLEATFHLADAVFQPHIAERAASARWEAARATTHNVLLEAALAYVDFLRAAQEKAIAQETLNNAERLADLTAAFARAGQGPQADADRASAELATRKNDVTRSEEAVEVASARLTELLRMDPGTILSPRESTVVPVELVAPGTPLAELLATALSNRPELAESRQLVCEAVARYRREKFAPLLPSALLAMSYGGFGGGPGGSVDHFRDRLDFDAAAFWEVRNVGFGEVAARDETRARYEQARLAEIQAMDRVAREVVEAHSQVQARRKQISVAESGVQSATDSYKRNMERIQAGEGLPIEVLQAIQALDNSRREYLRVVALYDEAQFRLYRALGWPIE